MTPQISPQADKTLASSNPPEFQISPIRNIRTNLFVLSPIFPAGNRYGAPGLTRTGTPIRATDFESVVSTNSTTGAKAHSLKSERDHIQTDADVNRWYAKRHIFCSDQINFATSPISRSHQHGQTSKDALCNASCLDVFMIYHWIWQPIRKPDWRCSAYPLLKVPSSRYRPMSCSSRWFWQNAPRPGPMR